MEPYQERVVQELDQLNDKCHKLIYFINGDTFKSVDIKERARLLRQYEAMSLYAEILRERIAAWQKQGG